MGKKHKGRARAARRKRRSGRDDSMSSREIRFHEAGDKPAGKPKDDTVTVRPDGSIKFWGKQPPVPPESLRLSKKAEPSAQELELAGFLARKNWKPKDRERLLNVARELGKKKKPAPFQKKMIPSKWKPDDFGSYQGWLTRHSGDPAGLELKKGSGKWEKKK